MTEITSGNYKFILKAPDSVIIQETLTVSEAIREFGKPITDLLILDQESICFDCGSSEQLTRKSDGVALCPKCLENE